MGRPHANHETTGKPQFQLDYILLDLQELFQVIAHARHPDPTGLSGTISTPHLEGQSPRSSPHQSKPGSARQRLQSLAWRSADALVKLLSQLTFSIQRCLPHAFFKGLQKFVQAAERVSWCHNCQRSSVSLLFQVLLCQLKRLGQTLHIELGKLQTATKPIDPPHCTWHRHS